MLHERMLHQRDSLHSPAGFDELDGLQNVCAGNVVRAPLLVRDGKPLLGGPNCFMTVPRVNKETRRGEKG